MCTDIATQWFSQNAINEQGGIYNRRLELIVPALGDSESETRTNVERLLSERQPFAMVRADSQGREGVARGRSIAIAGARVRPHSWMN